MGRIFNTYNYYINEKFKVDVARGPVRSGMDISVVGSNVELSISEGFIDVPNGVTNRYDRVNYFEGVGQNPMVFDVYKRSGVALATGVNSLNANIGPGQLLNYFDENDTVTELSSNNNAQVLFVYANLYSAGISIQLGQVEHNSFNLAVERFGIERPVINPNLVGTHMLIARVLLAEDAPTSSSISILMAGNDGQI